MADTAAFYRARAAEEQEKADSATLDNVRDRCLRAEAAWLAMAVRAERTATLRAGREGAAIVDALIAEPALHRMSSTRSASARYDGLGKDGRGSITTQSGALTDQFYGFATRFDNEKGTNPEELIAAAHASCFTMALAFALSRAGFSQGTLETRAVVTLDKDDIGFVITRSDLTLRADVPGITQDVFEEIAANAKATCPVSRLLNAEVTLTHELA